MKTLAMALFLSLYLIPGYADISAVEQYRVKNRAKKNNCYIYVEINGNSEWEKKKKELNTKIDDEAPFCNKITIMKIIKNVHITSCKRKSWDDIYRLNIGTIVEENPGVDLHIVTQIENSYINCGVLESTQANIGIHIENDAVMSEYENRVDIKNSKIGTGYILDSVAKKAKEFLDD